MKRLRAETIVAQALRDLDVNMHDARRRYDAMLEWCFEAEMLIGSQLSFPKRECEINVDNYRAPLPKDFFRLISIKQGVNALEYTGRDFTIFAKGDTLLNQTGGGEGNALADRQSYDSKSNVNHPIIPSLPKFSISDGFINVTIPSGKIGMAYLALPLDDDGMPLVHPTHAEAVTAYVKYMYLAPLVVQGKVAGGVYGEFKNRWLQLCGRARGVANMPDRRTMDYLGGLWNSFKPMPPQQQV